MITDEQIKRINEGDIASFIEAVHDLTEQLGSEPEEKTFRRGRVSAIEDFIFIMLPKIEKSTDCKTALKVKKELYHTFFEEIEETIHLSIFRKCPNCGHDNTFKESLDKYTCMYCDQDENTNF